MQRAQQPSSATCGERPKFGACYFSTQGTLECPANVDVAATAIRGYDGAETDDAVQPWSAPPSQHPQHPPHSR